MAVVVALSEVKALPRHTYWSHGSSTRPSTVIDFLLFYSYIALIIIHYYFIILPFITKFRFLYIDLHTMRLAQLI